MKATKFHSNPPTIESDGYVWQMVTPEEAEQVISTFYKKWDCTESDVRGKKRHRNIVECRQAICWFLRNKCGFGVVQIGDLLNKDHTSIIYHVRAMQGYIDTYPEYKFLTEL